jgi:hypothetical protein
MTSRKLSWPCLAGSLVAVCVFALAPALTAQSAGTGALTGTVTDPGGGVVPRATVSLVNTETNQTRSSTTGADGVYKFCWQTGLRFLPNPEPPAPSKPPPALYFTMYHRRSCRRCSSKSPGGIIGHRCTWLELTAALPPGSARLRPFGCCLLPSPSLILRPLPCSLLFDRLSTPPLASRESLPRLGLPPGAPLLTRTGLSAAGKIASFRTHHT